MSKKQAEADKLSDEPIAPTADTDSAAEGCTPEPNPEGAETPDPEPADGLRTQLDEMRDKYIRLSAEFDNYRKRTIREKADMLKFASEDTLRDMLPVVDDLERAAQAVETASEVEALKQGIALIIGKFHEFMKAKGVREIECLGQALDTDLHEAISKIPAPEPEQKGKIIDVVQKGYTINDKVMRFAKVVVAD